VSEDIRTVSMNAEQAAILDEVVIPTLMRAKLDDAAAELMALALQWRFTPPRESMPDNVVEIESWSRKVGA
jgi:uncharacterized membrane protein